MDIAFSDNPPELILLDVMMPGMDGYEVCRRLKGKPQTKNIPIIFVTGKTDEEDQVKGFNLGAIDYITKPFSAIIVKARVGMHAELQRYRDYLENISYLDGLTGISNRRKFDEYLESTWHLAIRLTMPISMILMDIDFLNNTTTSTDIRKETTALFKLRRRFRKPLFERQISLQDMAGKSLFVYCRIPPLTIHLLLPKN